MWLTPKAHVGPGLVSKAPHIDSGLFEGPSDSGSEVDNGSPEVSFPELGQSPSCEYLGSPRPFLKRSFGDPKRNFLWVVPKIVFGLLGTMLHPDPQTHRVLRARTPAMEGPTPAMESPRILRVTIVSRFLHARHRSLNECVKDFSDSGRWLFYSRTAVRLENWVTGRC